MMIAFDFRKNRAPVLGSRYSLLIILACDEFGQQQSANAAGSMNAGTIRRT